MSSGNVSRDWKYGERVKGASSNGWELCIPKGGSQPTWPGPAADLPDDIFIFRSARAAQAGFSPPRPGQLRGPGSGSPAARTLDVPRMFTITLIAVSSHTLRFSRGKLLMDFLLRIYGPCFPKVRPLLVLMKGPSTQQFWCLIDAQRTLSGPVFSLL